MRAERHPQDNHVDHTPHPPYPWLVIDGATTLWVQCPICCSTNEGWWKNGDHRFTGGVIRAMVPRGGVMYEETAACSCSAGQERQRGGLEPFTNLPPATEFLTQPAKILWTRGDTAPRPRERGAELPREMRHQLSSLTGRFLAREITLAEYNTLVAEIAEAADLPEPEHGPSLQYLVENPALMRMYSIRPEARMHRPQSDGRAAAAGNDDALEFLG